MQFGVHYFNNICPLVLECAVPLLALTRVPTLVLCYLAGSPAQSPEVCLLQLSPAGVVLLHPAAHPVCLQPAPLCGRVQQEH